MRNVTTLELVDKGLSKHLDIIEKSKLSLELLINLAKSFSDRRDDLIYRIIPERELFNYIPQRWVFLGKDDSFFEQRLDYNRVDNAWINHQLSTALYVTPSGIEYVRAVFGRSRNTEPESVMKITFEETPAVWLKDLSFFSEFSSDDVQIICQNIYSFFE